MSQRKNVGDVLSPLGLHDWQGNTVKVPPAQGLVHLQLRRFAGCPICDIHLQSFVKKQKELASRGISEVIVFHSTREEIVSYGPDHFPFPIIADPDKKLYKDFGAESQWDLQAGYPQAKSWIEEEIKAGRGVMSTKPKPENPTGGRAGLVADFLIDPKGKIVDLHYGASPWEHWSVDEVLSKAQQHSS